MCRAIHLPGEAVEPSAEPGLAVAPARDQAANEEVPAWVPLAAVEEAVDLEAVVVAECPEVAAVDVVANEFMIKENNMTSKFFNTLLSRISLSCVMASTLLAAPAGTSQSSGASQQPKGFDTPQLAAAALIQAAEKVDQNALLEIFGSAGKSLVITEDAVQSKNNIANFAKLAKEKMQVAPNPRDKKQMILAVGPEEWPLPTPIVKVKGKWQFDASKGTTEILARRIGENELTAIEACLGYVDAQNEYATVDHNGDGMLEYAQKIISSPGKKDGLYWRNADGSGGGPISEGIAKALEEGYSSRSEPYHGYRFKVLKAQGPSAAIGELSYVVNGTMIGGFAMVAWPAEYGATGIKTFIVSHGGIVYEKNLGPDTVKIASAIEKYDPDKSWNPSADQ
jgi:hypothetical protein